MNDVEHCDICGAPLTETEARWGTCDDCEGEQVAFDLEDADTDPPEGE